MNWNRRELLQLSGYASLAQLLPAPLRLQADAAPAPDPMLRFVNPQFRERLERQLSAPPLFPELNAATLPLMRSLSPKTLPVLPASPAVKKQTLHSSDGQRTVEAYIIGASPGGHKPLLLSIHGGGFVSGTASGDVASLQKIARQHDCVVLTVEYDLVPEIRYPGALEENYIALAWAQSHAKELGVDTERVVLMGGSAGGGHAAALALAVRDRREFHFTQLILIYPMLDDRTGSTRSVPPQIGRYMWTAPMNRFGWTSLLGVEAGSPSVPAGAVPARTVDLTGLPSTWIGVGSIDLFVNEDIEFASRLIAAGVPTELMVVPGAYHGFDGFVPDAPLSRAFSNSWNTALQRAFSGRAEAAR